MFFVESHAMLQSVGKAALAPTALHVRRLPPVGCPLLPRKSLTLLGLMTDPVLDVFMVLPELDPPGSIKMPIVALMGNFVPARGALPSMNGGRKNPAPPWKLDVRNA